MTEQTPPHAIALVGMPGAGKTLCAQHLEAQGYFQFRFGGIVTDEVERRGLPLTQTNERAVREEFRDQDGMAAIAIRALPHLKSGLQTHRTIVIDGLYSFSEYKMLKRELGTDMVLIAITCDRAVRYRRLATRPERPLTAAEAEERDHKEIENLEKGGPIAIADYTLLNNETTDSLLTQLDTLLATLGVRP